MNEILDLLPIPAARDLPAGHLEARRVALVAAVRAERVSEAFHSRVLRVVRVGLAKTWLSLLGVLALGIALLTLGLTAHQQPVQKDAVAFLAVAGTAQAALAVAPRVGLAVVPRC